MKGGKNYYVELCGEILAITKMANSGLDRDGAISPTQSRNRDLNLTFRWPGHRLRNQRSCEVQRKVEVEGGGI